MKSISEYDELIKIAKSNGNDEEVRRLEIEKQKQINIVVFLTYNRGY